MPTIVLVLLGLTTACAATYHGPARSVTAEYIAAAGWHRVWPIDFVRSHDQVHDAVAVKVHHHDHVDVPDRKSRRR